MKRIACALACAVLAGAALAADVVDPLQSEQLMRKTINDAGTAWSFYGPGVTSKAMKDAELPGGEFLRATVSRKGANPWDVGAIYPIVKSIKTGDVVFFAVYLRAPELKDGETASMPTMGVSQEGSPYAPIAVADARITNRWGVYYASARSTAAWPRGGSRISLQLASDKQVIDLGPVFALDLGKDYPIDTLPHN